MVEELIKGGVDVNLCDEYKMLLIIVCEKCYLNVVVVLIWLGVNVNMRDIINILLIIVCEGEEMSVVK